MTPDLDPERRLALAYVPAARRAALEALWSLDVTLGAVLATGSDPMISQIRLAWWREALEKLDHAGPPAEPLLQALARHVLPAGVGGAELAAMEEGWTMLLVPDPLGPEALHHYAETRGGRLFALSARLLGADAPGVEAAGAAWALIDLARRSGREAEARASVAAAAARPPEVRWPVPLRPLGMLAALARRDAARGLPLEAQGSPARMLRMLGHRLTGR
jgi:phytoene synthase